MKIGVDLDGVVANIMQPILDKYNPRYGTSWKYEDLYSHDVWEVFGITKQESMDRIIAIINSLSFDEVIAHEGAIESLRELALSHTLIAITSRPVSFKEKTLQWIKTHLPEIFKKVIFTNQYSNDHDSAKTTKSAICKSEGVEIMLEDYIEYVKDCAPVCKKVLMFSQPWNQGVELPKNAMRVTSWREVLDEINGRKFS